MLRHAQGITTSDPERHARFLVIAARADAAFNVELARLKTGPRIGRPVLEPEDAEEPIRSHVSDVQRRRKRTHPFRRYPLVVEPRRNPGPPRDVVARRKRFTRS